MNSKGKHFEGLITLLNQKPQKIVLEDLRKAMPYFVCTGGGVCVLECYELQGSGLYKRFYESNTSSLNRATGVFRDKSVDDTEEGSYVFYTLENLSQYLINLLIKAPLDIRIIINEKEYKNEKR